MNKLLIALIALGSAWGQTQTFPPNAGGGGGGITNPTNCSTGSYTTGINSTGAAQNCTALPTFPSGTVVGSSDAQTLKAKKMADDYVAGSGGTTANLLVGKDTSAPTQVVLPTSGGCGFGVALSTVSATGTVTVQWGGIATLVADNTVTAGDIIVGGTSTPGRGRDSGQTGRSGIDSATCVVGFAQTSAVTGATFTLLLTGPGDYGNQVNASSISTGTLPAGRMPAWTGDATSSAGATALTLATVNGGPGACGDATHVCVVTTNGKGLVTSQTPTAIFGGGVTYCGPASASATVYTCTPSPALTTYATGSTIVFAPDVTSGTTPTLNVSGLGAKNLKMADGSTAVLSGEFIGGKVYLLTYDGASLRLLDGTDATNITSGTLPNAQLGTGVRTVTPGCMWVQSGGLVAGFTCYYTFAVACTITGWSINVDAGTATVDVFKIAAGTTNPTSSITASAIPAISTGVAVRKDSTNNPSSFTGWTTAVSVGDIVGFNLKIVATATQVNFVLECRQ